MVLLSATSPTVVLAYCTIAYWMEMNNGALIAFKAI